MTGFVPRLLILIGGGTITALIITLTASGLVDLGIGEPWESGVIPALLLLGMSLLLALWHEATGPNEGPYPE